MVNTQSMVEPPGRFALQLLSNRKHRTFASTVVRQIAYRTLASDTFRPSVARIRGLES
jgi:hypothetical protein